MARKGEGVGMKYRKKPVEIEAVRASDVIHAYNDHDDGGAPFVPTWMHEAVMGGKVQVFIDGVVVMTLEGEMKGNKDDYIIQGVKGEIYPCKPDIFEATYERVLTQ